MADAASSSPSGTVGTSTYVSHANMRWLMSHIITIRYTYINHTNMRWLMSHHHRHQVHLHTSVTPTLQAADAGSGSQGLVWDTTTADCDPRKWVTTDFRRETHQDNCVWNQTSFESPSDAIIVTFGFCPRFQTVSCRFSVGCGFQVMSALHRVVHNWCFNPTDKFQAVSVHGWWLVSISDFEWEWLSSCDKWDCICDKWVWMRINIIYNICDPPPQNESHCTIWTFWAVHITQKVKGVLFLMVQTAWRCLNWLWSYDYFKSGTVHDSNLRKSAKWGTFVFRILFIAAIVTQTWDLAVIREDSAKQYQSFKTVSSMICFVDPQVTTKQYLQWFVL